MLDAEKDDATPATHGDEECEPTNERGVDKEEGLVEKNTDVDDEPEKGETDENEDGKEEKPTKSKKKGSSKRADKKPKSSSSLKNKKKKKNKDKKSKKTKKDDSKKKLIPEETGNTAEIETSGTTHDDGSRTHSKTSSTADDHEMNRISMKSLRKMEKARQSREGPQSFDTEDDGLWVGTTEESTMGYEKRKPDRRRRSSAEDDKADWEASVAADDSCRPYDSDADDSDGDYRDYSNRSIRSYRASGRSYRSTGGSSIRNSDHGFRSLKEDRNSSLHRSIRGEDETSDSETSEQKPMSQMELRKDLEAQALERVQKSGGEHQVGAIKATFKKFTEKSRKRLSSIFETPGSDVESEDNDDGENDSGKQEDKKKKLSRREQWLAFKRNTRTQKGYNVILSILLFIAVIVAIVLIVLLAA